MKKLFGVGLCAGVYLSTAIAFAAMQTQWEVADDHFSIDVNFPKPIFQMGADGRQQIGMEGLMNSIDAGLPSIPVATFKVALPEQAQFERVEFYVESAAAMEGEIGRSDSQLPISWPRTGSGKTGDDDKNLPYGGSRYPAKAVQANVQILHHVPIVIVDVFPVSENRDAHQIEWAQKGIVKVYFSRQNISMQRVAFRPHQAKDLKDFVDNASVINQYPLMMPKKNDYDYLVISTDVLINFSGESDISALRAALQKRGFSSRTVSTSDIQKTGNGVNLVEKIRNYIRSEYQKSGIRFVLLLGDADESGAGNMIPVIRLWSKVRAYTNGHWEWIEHNIPADVYYANLDGTFDHNGNGRFGEPNDGEGGGDVDLLSEVAVGRMPVETTSEMQNMIRKTIQAYENTFNKQVYLLGEELFSELSLTGGVYMDQLIGVCTDHGFQTNGYRDDWNIEKLYDKEGEQWWGFDALRKINSSQFSMINHLGHSNTTFNMRLNSDWDPPQWTSASPFFYYTQGCFPGDFTAHDCFIETMIRQERGAAGAIANTAYGLAPEDPTPASTKTPGASQMLHRKFIDNIMTQNLSKLGVAHQKSKEAFVGLASAQEIRWVYWVSNFFGDPSLELKWK